VWWWRFDAAPPLPELAAGVALAVLFFLVTTIVISAALLSFSIYELRRIPAIHQKPRGLPMIAAAIVLVALLFVPAYARRDSLTPQPMVVTTPTDTHIALIAVDGLTFEILKSRADLANAFVKTYAVDKLPGDSTTERWASLGTGVRTDAHGVRSIEGVRFRGGPHMLQRMSRGDFVLMNVAPALGIARREPLPPTVRKRDYVWEIVAGRGIPSIAVNWWATGGRSGAGVLHTIGPESIFPLSRGDALQVDAIATSQFLHNLESRRPRFATVYLPALDVVLNRLPLDPSTKLAQSLRALEAVAQTVHFVRGRRYDVVLVGMPGDGQQGSAVVAASPGIDVASAWDVAPTLLDRLGFPQSAEMPGRSFAASGAEPRIPTYGNRTTNEAQTALNQEYYDNLKSLGYIQ
jgi:hypothetical protein